MLFSGRRLPGGVSLHERELLSIKGGLVCNLFMAGLERAIIVTDRSFGLAEDKRLCVIQTTDELDTGHSRMLARSDEPLS